MNRDQRIAAAKLKLAEIEPRWEALKREYDAACVELSRAEESFDVGEHVRVEKTCRRGCCVEHAYEGVVENVTNNGHYRVRTPEGTTFESWSMDMSR
jgi:hypothetical protein